MTEIDRREFLGSVVRATAGLYAGRFEAHAKHGRPSGRTEPFSEHGVPEILATRQDDLGTEDP
jgi:hypothetical protein